MLCQAALFTSFIFEYGGESNDMQILYYLVRPRNLAFLYYTLVDRMSKFPVMAFSSCSKNRESRADQDKGPIQFFSGSKFPYCQFSNFYEVDIEMAEGVFPSVEHYFQGMKFIPEDRERFMKGGEFDKRKESKASNAREEVAKGRFAKSAGSKSGSAKYSLTLASGGLDQEVAKKRMKRALQKKFEQEPFRSLLLATRGVQLIHIPMRGRIDFWTGKKDKKTGEIVGENTMGKILMEIRGIIQENRISWNKRPHSDECLPPNKRPRLGLPPNVKQAQP